MTKVTAVTRAFQHELDRLLGTLVAPRHDRPWRGFVRSDRHVKNVEAPWQAVMHEVGQRTISQRRFHGSSPTRNPSIAGIAKAST